MPLEPVGSGVTSILVDGTEKFTGEQTGDAQYDVSVNLDLLEINRRATKNSYFESGESRTILGNSGHISPLWSNSISYTLDVYVKNDDEYDAGLDVYIGGNREDELRPGTAYSNTFTGSGGVPGVYIENTSSFNISYVYDVSLTAEIDVSDQDISVTTSVSKL